MSRIDKGIQTTDKEIKMEKVLDICEEVCTIIFENLYPDADWDTLSDQGKETYFQIAEQIIDMLAEEGYWLE